MRLCNWRPLFSPMLLFLTRRSWSLRKQQSLLHCALRSTTVWEESSSRRWVSPPRSVLKAAGPWATFFSPSPTLWCVGFYVFVFSKAFSSSLWLILSETSHHVRAELHFILSFISLHHSFPKNGNIYHTTPKHQPIHAHMPSLHPSYYLYLLPQYSHSYCCCFYGNQWKPDECICILNFNWWLKSLINYLL